jgi:copper oxidase (laccase) domain-containing protein
MITATKGEVNICAVIAPAPGTCSFEVTVSVVPSLRMPLMLML